MTPSRVHGKTLAGTIFHTVLAFSLSVVLVILVGAAATFFVLFENDAEERLSTETEAAARALEEADDPVAMAKSQFVGAIRYTYIAADGTVLADSAADAGDLENHADRPEVQDAKEEGEAVVSRYSETLQSDTLYAAVRLSDGSVIRLSEERDSLLSFGQWFAVPGVVMLAAVVALTYFVSLALTRRIMKPVDALNFREPLKNEIYAEMTPLLERIDAQQTQLRQQNEELARAENLRRDFSANVSHEMKTPLQVISGYAELMMNDMVQPADRQRFCALIYEEAQSMRSLINDVLTISRLDEVGINGERMERVDLHALAQIVAERLSSFAESNEVDIEVKGGPAYIMSAGTLAEEMVYNLVENGIRYNHPGGSVTVDVHGGPHGVDMTVSDTGPGVPDEYKEKIFERFFRLEKSRSKATGGTGLGLAIVKHAVQFHGGMITVESEMGKGTSFVLKFPSAHPIAKPAAQLEQAPSQQPPRR